MVTHQSPEKLWHCWNQSSDLRARRGESVGRFTGLHGARSREPFMRAGEGWMGAESCKDHSSCTDWKVQVGTIQG